ncbi:hypothetical protein [Gemmobacter denitrificans]|uniref:Membrane protein DUF2306 n=1 Tax=Gemmobacter denitrificans TaxID=3123040 RepID=A0ABU8C045_9RHOB
MQRRQGFGSGAKVAVVLSRVFHVAAGLAPLSWTDTNIPADAVFHTLLGVAVGFQGKALDAWQDRREMFDKEPRHLATFLLTFLGGGALLATFLNPIELLKGMPVTLAALYLVAPTYGVWNPKHDHVWYDQRYRSAQQEARTFGLRVFFLLAALIVVADNLNLLALPLWFVVLGCVWGVSTAMTGKMWLLMRNPSGLAADPPG